MTQERITSDPHVAGGVPLVRGSQVPVHEILDRAAAGRTPDEIIAEFPQLNLEDVTAAFAYAAEMARAPVPSQVAASSGSPSPDLDLNKILIVDDQELNRLYMQALFRDSEFTLSVAADGEEALHKARTELPFLVLSDIQMPYMDGFDLCRRIKSDERTQNASVIFVTAHHRSARKVSEGLDMGADDYIFRPFERNELLSRVRAVARLKRAEAEARRQAQIVARRNQALQTLNELALAVTSSLELKQIFNLSMQKLSRVLNAEALAFLLLNQEKVDIHLALPTGQRLSTTRPFQAQDVEDAWTVQERVPSVVADVLSGADLPLELKTISCLPMLSQAQLIGAIAIVNKQGGPLTDADWMLLHSAAGIIAVAVENARLLQSVQEQMVDLILLNEIGQALTSTLDLSQILERTTQLVQESLHAEAASLWLLDEDTQELVLTASSGPGAQLVTGFRLPQNQGIAGHVVRTGNPYFSSDVAKDSLYFRQVGEISNFVPGSVVCVPLQTKDQTIGVIQALHRNPHWFDQNDLRWLSSVASSVGIAVENGRLFAAVQEFNRRLERMVAERTRQLAEEKDKTEAILASMADGLLVLDAANRLLTMNAVAEEMLECCLDESLGQPLTPEQLENPLWRCIDRLARGDRSTDTALVDVPDATQLGGVRSIQAHSARVHDEAGQTIGTVIVLRDITALKEVERMKARFMAGVTHELKTPLSIIQLHTNNLKAYHTRIPDDRREDLLVAIQNQVRLLEQLVEDILLLSRMDANETRVEREEMDLVATTQQVVTALQPLAESQGVTIHWTPPGVELMTWAAPSQVERLVRNLVDNAIKYTPKNGSVSVALAEVESGAMKIQVTDTGIGIPQEHQAHIFDRFYRVDPSHTIPGTGLGLSIVKEIVEVMEGEIKLESAPGQGSTFTVILPRRGPEQD